MTIGMIVAIREEIDALFRTYGKPEGIDRAPGYEIYSYSISGHRIYVAESGAGEISAASATQYLITRYGVGLIVNFGVCGGLTNDMELHRTVVVSKAVHYDFDASPFDGSRPVQYARYPDIYIPADKKLLDLACQTEPSLKPVICASADKFIADASAKTQLHKKYAADICEMEAAGILLTADRNNIPALLIKGVSDSVSGGADEFAAMVHASAEICVRVLLRILDAI